MRLSEETGESTLNREVREFRRLERVCLEEANLESLDLVKSAYLKVAHDCRSAAEAMEGQQLARQGSIRRLAELMKLHFARPARRRWS